MPQLPVPTAGCSNSVARGMMVSAFTLIEAVIVIGVLLVLLGLLMPALGDARRAANLTAMLAQTQQYATAIDIYCNDYGDVYPLSKQTAVGTCAMTWGDPLIASGLLDASARVDSQDHLMSICMLFDHARMIAGNTPIGDISKEAPMAVRRQEVLYPSWKGLLFRNSYAPDDLPSGSRPEQEWVWCCLPGSPIGPVAFADGSAEQAHWTSLLPQGELYVENGVGYPVYTTWYGAHGRDR